MFERQVAELLRTYLGEYIDGLDNESLNVRVWKGTCRAAARAAPQPLSALLGCFPRPRGADSRPRARRAGDVVLRNLRLRPDALSGLGLPVAVRAGLCGSLTLKLPWSKLGSSPVVLSLDRVYLLAAPAQGVAAPRTPEEQARAAPWLR